MCLAEHYMSVFSFVITKYRKIKHNTVTVLISVIIIARWKCLWDFPFYSYIDQISQDSGPNTE